MAKNDSLLMSGDASVMKMLKKWGSPYEEVLLSANVVKVNKRGKSQQRALLITDKAMYNLLPNDYSKCKRRIALNKIISTTASSISGEFVLHVPDEYDYRLMSSNKDDILSVLSKQFKEVTGSKLKLTYTEDEKLEDRVVTKQERKNMTREEVMMRRRQLAAEDHDSDHEEDKGVTTVEHLVGSDTKLSIDSFELLKVLGRGSFGKVMMVKKRDDGRIYAMKILKKSMLVARHQVDHTKAERKILEVLQHPFLMGLRFAFQTKVKLYLVMQFYKGGELFFHLKKKRRFTEAEARLIVAEVAAALGHLHKAQFIYRDLKPENILLDEHGHICLTDFGLSKDVNPDDPEAHTFCGTPEYLAPEILKSAGHGKSVDWWSLGILLYELTVGIPPFYSGNVNEMYHKIQNGVLRFPPFLSEECKSIIVGLLNRNPESRLGSSDRDVEELKEHAFFREIDWDKLHAKAIEPPYKPKVGASETNVDLFEKGFTDETPVDTYVPENQYLEDDGAFDGFTFQAESKLN